MWALLNRSTVYGRLLLELQLPLPTSMQFRRLSLAAISSIVIILRLSSGQGTTASFWSYWYMRDMRTHMMTTASWDMATLLKQCSAV